MSQQEKADHDLHETAPSRSQARMAFLLGLRARGISDIAVLRAMESAPREIFVPRQYADLAWRDIALPIACGQTMPEPWLVAAQAIARSKLAQAPAMRRRFSLSWPAR
jgi:protein-L-isoaspartate O-methyltransferase